MLINCSHVFGSLGASGGHEQMNASSVGCMVYSVVLLKRRLCGVVLREKGVWCREAMTSGVALIGESASVGGRQSRSNN